MATGASTEETGEERVMQSSREAIHVAVTVAFIVLCGFLIIFFILFCNSAHLEVPLYLGWGILVVGIIFLFLDPHRLFQALWPPLFRF